MPCVYRPWAFLSLAFCLLTPPLARQVDAHLVTGRRPLDTFLRETNVGAFVTVVEATITHFSPHGKTRLTRVRIDECVTGACPRGEVVIAGWDDHAALLEPGGPYFFALKREPVRADDYGTVRWRVLQNDWELYVLRPDEQKAVRRYARAHAELFADGVAGSADHVALLLAQSREAHRKLRDDALLSLVKLAPAEVVPEAKAVLFSAIGEAATAPEASAQTWLLVGARWDPNRLRRTLAGAGLENWPSMLLAKALHYLGEGNRPEAALPCAFLGHAEAGVRAAAVHACRPLVGDWLDIALQALESDDEAVRKMALSRLRAHPERRRDVEAWALGFEPWWRRVWLRATDKQAPRAAAVYAP